MSEERMDRKYVARSVPSKAAAGDCKKSSDAVHKPWPRSSKKREGGSSSRNEVPRRNVPPPRAAAASGRVRAHAHRSALGGEEGSGLAEEEAELGSVFVPGSKKQSLNHLLQFVYSPRDRGGEAGGAVRRTGGGVARPRSSAVHPHHAELYLQASCQFAVRAGAGDYSRHLLDPDLPVDWRLVEHVVVRSAGVSECPICLSAPVAARVTRCGHVYCWACALHYAAVHERSPPPCPVCAAPFLVAQLKSARLQRVQPPQQEVVMRLVRRARGSTLVELAPEQDVAGAEPALPAWTPHTEHPYAKILTITTQQVHEIMQRERAELSQQILNEIDTSELEYLEQALELLRQSETELAARAVVSLAPPPAPTPPAERQRTLPSAGPRVDWFDEGEAAARLAHCVEEVKIKEEERENSLASPDAPELAATWSEDSSGSADAASSVSDDAPHITDKDKENQAKYFYFYQAEDGQHVFLHGVNVRLLTASWGALAAAPRRISGRVLHTESACLTAQTRGRVPCAAHLPLYCAYELLELELQPPHVTPRALLLHAEELERRARARVRAEREERRRERRAAAAGRAPPAPHLASLAHFPPALPPSPPSPPPLQPPPPHQPHSTALSFAKMAGGSGTWRVRSPRAVSPPPDAAPEHEPPPPPRALCLSDAIEAALHAPAPPSARTKKSKRRVLFATGVQRAA